MNYIDIIILLFLLYGAVRGFMKGLVVEVVGLVGLLAGGYCAMRHASYAGDFLRDFTSLSADGLKYAAWAATFLVVFLACWLVGKLVTRLLEIIALGLVNRFLGAVFGAGKCFLLACILVMFLQGTGAGERFISTETRQGSMLYGTLSDTGCWIGEHSGYSGAAPFRKQAGK